MSVLRFISTLFLLVAVIALIADLTPMLSGSEPLSFASVETRWREVAPVTFESMEQSITGGRDSALWTFLIGPLLAVPTWLMFAILSAIAGYVGRRRTRIKIYAN